MMINYVHSQHMPHVDLPILLMYCYDLLQFESGKQNSQGGGNFSHQTGSCGNHFGHCFGFWGPNLGVGGGGRRGSFGVTCQIGR